MKTFVKLQHGYGYGYGSCTHLSLLLLLVLISSFASATWISPPCRHHGRAVSRRRRNSSSLVKTNQLFSKPRNDSDKDDSSCQLSVSGVSVSPEGFWMLLKSKDDDDSKTLAIKVTSSTEDAVAATSAESLTILQLISGVDMAGPILPPEFLGQVAVLHCEFSPKKTASEQALLDMIQDTLPNNGGTTATPYSECNSWQQSRVRFPKLSLDKVSLESGTIDKKDQHWTLECSVPQFPQMGKIFVKPTKEVLQSCVYQYDSQTSAAFSSLALALRYKAPLVLQQPDKCQLLNDTELKEKFPNLRTVSALKSQSERVHENIERGFEIHKLTGALRIAMEKGDTVAAKSIRERLDQYDSMDDLPTLGNNNNSNNMEDGETGLDKMQ